MDAPTPPLYIDRPEDVAVAARALAGGAIVAAAFANFYVIVTRPDAATVRRVNLAKGRPVHQVGSITTRSAGSRGCSTGRGSRRACRSVGCGR